MAGGLMQLVAYGAQDVFLTGTPEITFWKVSYRRHTNFAMESIEQTFSGQADFGRRVTCTISRNGDLCYRTYLQVTLPEINQNMNPNAVVPPSGTQATSGVYARWLDYIGEQMISQIEVEIGGQRIDRQYGDWMHIWNQMTLSSEQQRGYFKMIGNTTQLTYITDPSFSSIQGPCSNNGSPNQVCAPRNALPETTLYIPLLFWFCRNPGLALPLIALQYHEVKFNLDIRPIGECLWAVNTLNPTVAQVNANSSLTVTTAYQQSLVAASLYVDYIFLDTDERRKMAQNPHEYLIEQLQFTGDESVGSSSNKIKLNFNHPVKELIWVVQPDMNVDYCSALDAGTMLYKTMGAQPFNYTDAIDVLPNSLHCFGGPQELMNEFTSEGLFTLAGAGDAGVATGNINRVTGAATTTYQWADGSGDPFQQTGSSIQPPSGGSYVSDAGTFVLGETALDMHCWGENPCVTAKLQLNGQDRFSEREGSYFDVVQPFQHHSRAPDTGINIYSFALRPEEHQPSGSCNFSRIDNAVLQLILSGPSVGGVSTAKVRVYAINYNVLRVMSGMAGIAYSN
jgi:Large eukaryotic DNA virus major capsid protein/Major capsid protein N-terminus